MNKVYNLCVTDAVYRWKMVFLNIVPFATEKRDIACNKNHSLHFLENLFRFKLIALGKGVCHFQERHYWNAMRSIRRDLRSDKLILMIGWGWFDGQEANHYLLFSIKPPHMFCHIKFWIYLFSYNSDVK